MRSKHPVSLLKFAVSGLLLLTGTLQAGTIGAAQGFGAFIFGNSTDSNDIASRIAIAGNGPSNQMGVGNDIQSGPTILTANPNVVAVVEGSGANGGVTAQVGQQVYNAGGTVNNATKLPNDPFLTPANGGQSIASYRSFYETLSSQLGGLSSTAGAVIGNNVGQGIILSSTGISATTVVYNLTATQWANLGVFNFNANQTIIINVAVSGSATGGGSYNFTANGSQPGNTGNSFGNILFNFVGATGTVSLGNEGFGTILAPDATITSGSVVNGQIIATTLGSIGELHDASAFTGRLPSGPATAPEPGTLVLFGGGLLAFGVFGKRFVKRRRTGNDA